MTSLTDEHLTVRGVTTTSVALHLMYGVFFVISMDTFLHWLWRRMAHNYKYLEFVQKITQELMIIGLIYFLIKFLMYMNVISYRGQAYEAFDNADMLIFLVALTTTCQALAIICCLRWFNHIMDQMGNLWSFEIVEQVEQARPKTTWCFTSFWHSRRVELKLLEVFFRSVNDLPPLFSFAKYIREVQERQIVELLEIDFTTWGLLVTLFYLFFVCTKETTSLYYPPLLQNRNYDAINEKQDCRVTVFMCFTYGLMTATLILVVYLRWIFRILVQHAAAAVLENSTHQVDQGTLHSDVTIWKAIECLALVEGTEVQFNPKDALAKMKFIGEGLEDMNEVHEEWQCVIIELLLSWARKCRRRGTDQLEANHTPSLRSRIDDIHLPFFNRKVCQTLLQILLVINGLYYAIALTVILPTISGTEAINFAVAVLPIVVTTVFLVPRAIRIFSLLRAIWKAEGIVLARVIEHFVQAEERKSTLIHDVLTYCNHTNQTLDDIRRCLDGGSGYVEFETLRHVLKKFGHRMSRHDCHAFVRVMDISTIGSRISVGDLLALFPSQAARKPLSHTATLSPLTAPSYIGPQSIAKQC